MSDYNTILAEYQEAYAKASRYLQIHHADSEDAVKEVKSLYKKLKEAETAQTHYFSKADKPVQ